MILHSNFYLSVVFRLYEKMKLMEYYVFSSPDFYFLSCNTGNLSSHMVRTFFFEIK